MNLWSSELNESTKKIPKQLNFMLCDCMVEKFSQRQCILQIAHWNSFCQVWAL